MDYRTLTALELGALLREGSLSAAGAAKAGLDRLAQAQGRSNAFITVTKEDAMLRADQVQRLLDARRAPSPLAGVPMAFKDNICPPTTPLWQSVWTRRAAFPWAS